MTPYATAKNIAVESVETLRLQLGQLDLINQRMGTVVLKNKDIMAKVQALHSATEDSINEVLTLIVDLNKEIKDAAHNELAVLVLMNVTKQAVMATVHCLELTEIVSINVCTMA